MGIFLLVAAITAFSVFSIERGEAAREIDNLNERARSIASALERRGNASSAYLRAGAAMFAAVDSVDEPLFNRFVSELQLDFDYRGAEGIGWAENLRSYELGRFRIGAAEGLQDEVRIRPAPTSVTTRVVPVTFLRPATERNRSMLGYDLYSEPVRREAMDEAARLAQPTASGKLVLADESAAHSPGFVIFMPVYAGDGPSRRLRGFVYSPFDANDFLVSALELADAGERGVRLYDGEATPDRLLAQVAVDSSSGIVAEETIQIANREMVVEVESVGSYSLSPLSMLTLLFGLLVATLLLVVARLVTQQTREDQLKLEWLEEQDSIRNSLTRELNHRVKNTLANVLSIVALTRRRSDSLEEFADGLDGRIRAISATHDLLTQSEWGTTPIRAVVEAELAPHARDEGEDFVIAGPEVELAPNDALTLGLAIHELATNASKFGALSKPGGHVSVTWSLEGKTVVRLEWVEGGGPRLEGKPSGRGFGLDLIEKIVAHELNQEVELEFPPEGVRCTLRIPVRRPSQFVMRATSRRVEETAA